MAFITFKVFATKDFKILFLESQENTLLYSDKDLFSLSLVVLVFVFY